MTQTEALAQFHSAIGVRAFAYVLAHPEEKIPDLLSGSSPISPAQVEVAGRLAAIQAQINSEIPEDQREWAARAYLYQLSGGKPLARLLHDHAAGRAEHQRPSSTAAEVIREIALDIYGSFLFPSELPDLPFRGPAFSGVATQAYYKHPDRRQLATLVMEDQKIAKIFYQPGDDFLGPSGQFISNAGLAGIIQLDTLLHSIFERAWGELPAGATPEDFSLAAADCFEKTRAVLIGEAKTVLTRIHFTGVLLPDDCVMELAEGRVRPTRPSEYQRAPQSLAGQLQASSESGEVTTIEYSGDIAFEVPFDYKFKIGAVAQEKLQQWWEQNLPGERIEQTVTRLRFALLMAVKREHRVQIIGSWQVTDDPLSGSSMSWSDTKNAGITPTRLTQSEVDSWGRWYERLKSPGIDKVQLALRRVLRAMSERRDPADVLIDSVIAWENLFGTKDGEPTFRITMCLATLLRDDPEERVQLRTELGKIYNLRSKIVHGSADLKPADVPQCDASLEIAIDAIKALIDQRPDILALPDGAQRSTNLLLGA
ncbi:HEPN domain-containing protein [Kitasatospora purpeofusca]|uniref:hypothetical protein n=1 Tax=Kitasatospora purpeofusca TaxID=67352 RepID=UPI0032514928